MYEEIYEKEEADSEFREKENENVNHTTGNT